MTPITGRVVAGRIELDAPLPSDWHEGTQVYLQTEDSHKPQRRVDPKVTIERLKAVLNEPPDLNLLEPILLDPDDDSEDGITAWVLFNQALHRLTSDSTFPEELADFLAQAKAQELANWEARSKKLEDLFR
ncbi:MAG: hypothetical protein ACRC8S_00925 [Fimbriiglobus sp.]